MAIPVEIFLVTSNNSPEFELLVKSLADSSIVGFDAEWKPFNLDKDRDSSSKFPTVTLLQIACREAKLEGETKVFLVDLLSLELSYFWKPLKDLFESPSVLKVGFRFKQDLMYLSSTFSARGCHGGFDKVEPFIDITSVYHYMNTGSTPEGQGPPKQSASLATICKQILGVSLSKELQCSDWSIRPLTDEQMSYAVADAYYLLDIFAAFLYSLIKKGDLSSDSTNIYSSQMSHGLKDLFQPLDISENILRIENGRVVGMLKSNVSKSTIPLDISRSKIVEKYGEKIVLLESDRKPRTSKLKGKRRPSSNSIGKDHKGVVFNDWVGPPPWDLLCGGDECPRFLCDVMVEGLAKYLRCVGIDAAIPSAKKPEPRLLLDQAYKDRRVILTRDAKLFKYQYLAGDHVYKVKSLIKKDQLLEVIETFKLKISEEQLMSRCTKCNGAFIQKPLTIEEAIIASKGFQVIPNCLFNRDLEFWQCVDCGQLYWEGTQYQNAVQRFMNVCKLTD